ncbi:WD40-repeat-containing domain protein [Baffinella frigidus]|nr:WD40-repeat-containing domain protein [Cryptophyta sp. CCMP2293]
MLLAAGHAGGGVRVHLLDASGGVSSTNEPSVPMHRDAVSCLFYVPGAHILLTGSVDSTVRVWPLDQSPFPKGAGIPAIPSAVLSGHEAPVTCVAGCADLGVVVSGASDGTARFIRRLLANSPGPGNSPIRSVAISGRGTCVALAEDGALFVIDLNAAFLHAAPPHEDPPRAFTLSPDSALLLLTRRSGQVDALWADTLEACQALAPPSRGLLQGPLPRAFWWS